MLQQVTRSVVAGRLYCGPLHPRCAIASHFRRSDRHRSGITTCRGMLDAVLAPFQSAWGTGVLKNETLSQVLAPQLFAFSLFPYLVFLYFLQKGAARSGAPRMMVWGFCFLLVFVFETIPAGIYAKKEYGTSLANVDWLHGTSELLLTITNLLIDYIDSRAQPGLAGSEPQPADMHLTEFAVFGLRQGILDAERGARSKPAAVANARASDAGEARTAAISEDQDT